MINLLVILFILYSLNFTSDSCYIVGFWMAMEIESKCSTCFIRNLWRRNKRTTILFLINNYWIYSITDADDTLATTSSSETEIGTSNSFFYTTFCAIWVFIGITFWIKAFDSSSETSEKRERDAILHYLFTSRWHYLSWTW